jgi:hypothetical protein
MTGWAAGAAALSACSSLDPHVGALQQCVSVNGPPDDSRYYTSVGPEAGIAPYTPSTDDAAQTTCAVPAGSACDDCESTNCCATRLACYGDPTCAAADQALDACLAGVSGDASADGGTTECWQAFASQGGGVAQTRLACERTCCPSVCAGGG